MRYCCCCWVTKQCPTVCDPMKPAARQASLSFTVFRSLLKLMSVESLMLFNHLILCCSLLLLPSTFPSVTVFSSDGSSPQVAQVLKLQLQSFQWIFRVDLRQFWDEPKPKPKLGDFLKYLLSFNISPVLVQILVKASWSPLGDRWVSLVDH